MTTQTPPLALTCDYGLYVVAMKDGTGDVGVVLPDGAVHGIVATYTSACVAINQARDWADEYGCPVELLPSAAPFEEEADRIRAARLVTT